MLYCLYVPHREPDPQQIAGVWCDLAAALFGASSDRDAQSKEDRHEKRESGDREKKMDRKTQITRREKKKMLGQLRGIFEPL